MKFLLNKAYGGFCLPAEFIKRYPQFDYSTERNDPDFIKAAEEFGVENMPDLKVVTISGNVTDWDIDDYDGYETLIYVLDGKLGRA